MQLSFVLMGSKTQHFYTRNIINQRSNAMAAVELAFSLFVFNKVADMPLVMVDI